MHFFVPFSFTESVPPCTRPTGMEESDPVNGWPQQALSLWDMMMMKHFIVYRLVVWQRMTRHRSIFLIVNVYYSEA